MTGWKSLLAALAIAAAPAAAAGQRPDFSDIEWLAGDWIAQTGSRWTEERWARPRGGVMLGTGLSGKGEEATSYEFMRIAADADGALAFWGSPGGKPPVPFKLVSSNSRELVFENPRHDYPTRIVYQRTGSGMTATTTGPGGGNRQVWRYRRRN
jgi:hypothetical protein